MTLSPAFGLYIHIPFCWSKCPYCSFYSVKPADLQQIRAYVDAIVNQARQISSSQISSFMNNRPLMDNRPLKSIYLGGGTPSVLGVSEINRLISSIFKIFRPKPGIEVTIEANPGDIDDSFFLNPPFYFNRISIGVQSFNSRILRFLQRRHTPEKALQALGAAKKAGLNVSGDLIFNVPGQSLGDFMTDLDIMIKSGIDHVSLYDLHVEPDTPMYPLENQDQELNWLMYSHALKRLSKAGIRQYEVSNFSRPGFESSHNLCYWSGTDFLGLGPGASSFARPLRWTFKGGVKEFITYFGSDNPDNPCMAARALSPEIYDIENISPIDQMSEFMFMGLRKKTGIQDIEFENLFNSSFYTIYGDTIKKLVSHDLLWSGNSAVGLTEKGFMLGNRVFMEFLDEKG